MPSAKRPVDTNKLAKLITDIATGEVEDVAPPSGKDPAAVALGKKGGLKGGNARAASLTPEQRSDIAKKAANERWKDRPKQPSKKAAESVRQNRKVLSVDQDDK